MWQTLQEPNTYYDYKLSVDGRSHRYGTADRDYVTDVLTRRTARLIRRYAPDDKPFYLQLDEWPHYGRGRGTGSCEVVRILCPRLSTVDCSPTSHCPSRRLSTRRT